MLHLEKFQTLDEFIFSPLLIHHKNLYHLYLEQHISPNNLPCIIYIPQQYLCRISCHTSRFPTLFTTNKPQFLEDLTRLDTDNHPQFFQVMMVDQSPRKSSQFLFTSLSPRPTQSITHSLTTQQDSSVRKQLLCPPAQPRKVLLQFSLQRTSPSWQRLIAA